MSQLERISTGMFAKDEHGVEFMRPQTCRCGASFTQRSLSMEYLDSIQRIRQSALDAITRAIPGYWVPLNCPPCERKSLSAGRYTVGENRGAA